MTNKPITIIETIPDPTSEMAAEIGAQSWVEAQAEIRQMRQQVQGLVADREALGESYRKAIALISSVARQAASARYDRDADRIKALTTIQLKLDHFLGSCNYPGSDVR